MTTNPLPEHIKIVKQILEKKGWCVVYHDFYIGLTGYKKSTDTGKLEPRESHIVSLNPCSLVSGNKILNDRWEVRTYWTSSRNLFSEFEPAWALFLEEEAKYNPKKIRWAVLENQEMRNGAKHNDRQ